MKSYKKKKKKKKKKKDYHLNVTYFIVYLKIRMCVNVVE